MMTETPSLRSKAATFGLSEPEFDLVIQYLKREPNALEAAMFGALWSEHCGYKNSRPLLKRLPTQGSQVLQGPGENAGVIDVGEGWAVAFKMESHNHPSAVEPVQGAATGVGGILRDIFAMGARPIAVLDSLRFGELSSQRTQHLLHGVIEGIAHYGNAIGVPTVGGEVSFHHSFEQNPLVNVMAIGLMRHDDLQKGTLGQVGNAVIYVGAKTGRDGLGGAVFASADLNENSDADRPAVQVGDPFMEKLLLEATIAAIHGQLVAGVQDMGAAGLTSSVGEMAYRAGLGVDVHVDLVPRRETGMSALEVMLSESQERMVLIPVPGKEQQLLELLHHWELDACVIGHVADHGRFRIIEHGQVIGDMPVPALNEAPTYTRDGQEDPRIAVLRQDDLSQIAVPADLNAVLLQLLSHPSVASKQAIYERYDHQVMNNTVVLPGAADAAVLRIKGSSLGIAATTDCNPRLCYLDPYRGAVHAVLEASRNLSCVGALPLAITDNLNFGNPNRPDVYYQLTQAIHGLRDACIALDTPVTGGNVSLYNQYNQAGETRAIHPTPAVGMVGVLADINKRATQGFKRLGDHIVLLGAASDAIDASLYLETMYGIEAGVVSLPDLTAAKRLNDIVRALIEQGYCDTAHDVSEGGLLVAVAEMAISGDVGAKLTISASLLLTGGRIDALLFGEAGSAIVVAIADQHWPHALAMLSEAQVPHHLLGQTAGDGLVVYRDGANDPIVNTPISAATAAFEAPLQKVLG
jgi:phosphoribosylformylglycinamidine synthase subunit PurL